MNNIDNMANLLESIPYQPIDENKKSDEYWVEIALPLVRKVFRELSMKEECLTHTEKEQERYL